MPLLKIKKDGFATFAAARAERDRLLAATDWTQTDPELASSDVAAYATYRSNVKSAVTSAMSPADVSFPDDPGFSPVVYTTTSSSNCLEVPFETPTWGHINFNGFGFWKVKIISGASLGSVNLDPDTGEFLYTPLPTAYGSDSFTYQVGHENVEIFYVKVLREHSLPVAVLSAEQAASPALTVDFDGSQSYPTQAGATITDYNFDFGDGASSSGSSATASHTYGTTGNYTATLTVTDSLGSTANDSTMITVE